MKDIFIPNVISPYDREWNSSFETRGIGGVPLELSLYNRWGIEIYQSNKYRGDWPSQESELPMPETIYYLITYHTCPPRKGWLKIVK